MDLLEVMRTTFACREFQDEKIEDEVTHRILDSARFAPSGGNRQGVHVVVVKDPEKKRKLGQLCGPTLLLYDAQRKAGEVPFNTVEHSSVSEQEIDKSSVHDFEMFNKLEKVPLLLIVSIDLSAVASMDKGLERIGVVTGASVYPFVWNILMAARNEGLGGVITTAIVPEEESVREILDFLSAPEEEAFFGLYGSFGYNLAFQFEPLDRVDVTLRQPLWWVKVVFQGLPVVAPPFLTWFNVPAVNVKFLVRSQHCWSEEIHGVKARIEAGGARQRAASLSGTVPAVGSASTTTPLTAATRAAATTAAGTGARRVGVHPYCMHLVFISPRT